MLDHIMINIPHSFCKLLQIVTVSLRVPPKSSATHSKFMQSTQELFGGDIGYIGAIDEDSFVMRFSKVPFIVPAFQSKPLNCHRSGIKIFVLWIAFNVEVRIIFGSGAIILILLHFLDKSSLPVDL